MAEANAAVHAAREHAHAIENQAQQVVHSVRSEAQSTVQEAHAHVRSVESRAHSVMEEMQECHRQELAEAQRIANQAHAESSQRLIEADVRIQQLLGMIDSQAQQLEAQRKEQEGLAAQVSLLQNELTMLRHAAPSQPLQAQDQNGAVNSVALMEVVSELRRELQCLRFFDLRKTQVHNQGMPVSL